MLSLPARLWLDWALRVLVVVIAFLGCEVKHAQAQIPRDAGKYRHELTRNARLVWGLTAPIADLSGQIQQESSFREDATSPVGAQGLTQFMPATAAWIAGVYPELGPPQPQNAAWAIRAQSRYMKHLYDRAAASDGCNQMAKALSGYNGGEGWMQRDEVEAAAAGLDWQTWWGQVETVRSKGRSEANWNENRAYPRRILHLLAPRYVAAGWGRSSCD